MNILLSIKPKWARLIYDGKKTIEWRKSTPNAYRPGMRVYLYETVPVQKVTGYFDYQAFYGYLNCNRPEVNQNEIEDLVKQGCVPFPKLKAYQGKSERIVGWIVKNATKLDIPMDLEDFGIKCAPQSWCYLKEKI